MKVLIIVFAVCGVSIFQSATLSFDKKIYDFKKIKAGKIVEVQFLLTNTSKKIPLVIYSVSTTCGCTTAKAPKLISPQKSEIIAIKFNSTGYKGLVSKDIVVITNSSSEYDKLTIKGEVLD